MTYLSFMLWVFFATPANAQAHPDPIKAQAQNLIERADANQTSALSAIDLIRLDELHLWLMPRWVEDQLKRSALQPKRHPLARAVAWWLVRKRALERLDIKMVQTANDALGLQTGFAYRPGPAPHPNAILKKENWHTYPTDMGHGVIWLDSVIRPRNQSQATLASQLISKTGGPAVLRLGYDDAVTVWLNGDEVYSSDESHNHWLDQAAVRVHLRPGANRLVVQVDQKANAWRFMLRVTNSQGEVLPVRTDPRPWGPTPEPAVGPFIDGVEHIWAKLFTVTDGDTPSAQSIRDLADYARVAHLPNRDQTLIQVTMEMAWSQEPSHITLRAWLRLLDEKRRERIRGTHKPKSRGLDYAGLMVRLEEAWDHFFARRLRVAWSLVQQILKDAPYFSPAHQLHAVLYEDAGFPLTGSALVVRPRHGSTTVGHARAQASLLREAGRFHEEAQHLTQMLADGLTSIDVIYRLGLLAIKQGRMNEAIEYFDRIVNYRPALWNYELELVDALARFGDHDNALKRLTKLWKIVPQDIGVGRRLVHIYLVRGQSSMAQKIIGELTSGGADPELLDDLEKRVAGRPDRPAMGPDVTTFRTVPCPQSVAAIVLYQHARVQLDDAGRADRWVRRVLRICSKAGARRYETVNIIHVPSLQTLDVRVARRFRSGRPLSSPKRSDHGVADVGARLYFDMQTEKLTFPKSRVGDVIEVVWRLRDTQPHPAFPGDYGEVAYLQEEIPRHKSVVEYITTTNKRFSIGVFANGLKLAQATQSANGLTIGTVVATDVLGVPAEPRMPGPTQVYAHAHLSTIKTWDEVESKYEKLLADRQGVTPQIKALARRLTLRDTSRTAILESLFLGVMERVRYVGLEYGIHGFQPSRPMDTWERGYGDCKDKALLLKTLLAARGIKSHFVLVRTREEGRVRPDSASWAVFNHAMLYLPSKNVFVDPTIDHTSPVDLPSGDEGASVLVVGLKKGLQTVPFADPSQHRDAWNFDVRLDSMDRLTGEAQWTVTGVLGAQVRRRLADTVTRTKRASRYLGLRLPGASFNTVAITEPGHRSGKTVLDGSIQGATLYRRGNHLSIPVGLQRWRLVEQFAPTAKRRHPRVSLRASHTEIKWLLRGIKPGRVRLPESITINERFGQFSLSCSVTKRGVQVTVRLQLKASTIDSEDYAAYRRWLSQIEETLSQNIEVYTHAG